MSSHLCRSSQKDQASDATTSAVIRACEIGVVADDLFFLVKQSVSKNLPHSLHREFKNCKIITVTNETADKARHILEIHKENPEPRRESRHGGHAQRHRSNVAAAALPHVMRSRFFTAACCAVRIQKPVLRRTKFLYDPGHVSVTHENAWEVSRDSRAGGRTRRR